MTERARPREHAPAVSANRLGAQRSSAATVAAVKPRLGVLKSQAQGADCEHMSCRHHILAVNHPQQTHFTSTAQSAARTPLQTAIRAQAQGGS